MELFRKDALVLKLKEITEKFPPWVSRLKWPGGILLATLVLAVIGYLIIIFGGSFVVDEKKLILDSKTTVETKDGQVIEEIYAKNRKAVPASKIPKHVKQSFVAIEDSRYYDHAGIDIQAIGRAVYRDIAAMKKVEGGSTITQQLAKNLFLTNDKTWMRKTKEMMAAIYLERHYSKDELLGKYLNQIYFGDGVYGIEAASRYYFNQDVSDLSVAQGALLAGLPKAPNSYSPFDHPGKAKERRDLVLQRMEDLGMIDINEMLKMQGSTLAVRKKQTQSDETWSNSYVDAVIKEAADKYQITRDELKRGGYRIIVEMDPAIQKVAYNKMKNGEYVPGSKGDVEGAFALVDTSNGALVAAVGGRDFKHGEINRTLRKHQPGSTIKPLAVYGPALMENAFVPYSLLVDEPKTYGSYQPENYDHQYDGTVSLYEALVESKNAPAVWLLNEIGIDTSKKYLKELDLPTEDKGLSIALGGLSNGYSPVQMAQAYSSIANQGKMQESYTIQRIMDRNGKIIHRHTSSEKQVFSTEVAWDLTEMLKTTVEDGTAVSGAYAKALAGKTGTQQHPTVKGKNKDVWFTGYTPEYACALWMGYDQSGKEYYLNGGSEYPTRLMKDILTDVDRVAGLSDAFSVPKGLKPLPKPVQLPSNISVTSEVNFGGLSLIKGTLKWTPASDKRIIYRVYRVENGQDVKIGEVTGEGEFALNVFSVFQNRTYYVVPVDPLTGKEGEPSNQTTLQFKL
ncbi:PBP1A family penicillin-binding protein [Halobacillus salinarum]|uniref:PBP1A family penicillin-binding protein n=1 Tax=Halobacillus salinarum TaxID=2932257 RepID=A0ABY4EN06_9BACI|nr:PBP1A family penicillin-binding protein [Halobacillus salinarum]UOQ43496.1 PBP1A family penicillin-binding protein [Halobacillus salinarum]